MADLIVGSLLTICYNTTKTFTDYISIVIFHSELQVLFMEYKEINKETYPTVSI